MPTPRAVLAGSLKSRPVKRVFSLAEANRTLSYVVPVTRDVMGCYAQVADLRRRLEFPHPDDCPKALGRAYQRIMDQLGVYVEELRLMGAQAKDFGCGRVDFPAIRDGRAVCLCWQYGEPRIGHWHEPYAGCGGRQLLTA